MAPAALYLNTTSGVGFSREEKIALAMGIPAILIAIFGVFVQILPLLYPVVRAPMAAPCADVVTSTSSVDGHESE